MTDRFNQPDYLTPGGDDSDAWNVQWNQNFADLGVEVQDTVQSWGDLPETSETSSHGNPDVYRVEDDNLFVAVDGDGRRIIGGLGSEANPLPPSHHEAIHTDEGSIGSLSAGSVGITEFSTGPAFDIWKDGDDYYAFEGNGELVAGGPDALNVADSTDFGAILDDVLNNQAGEHAVIRLGQRRDSDTTRFTTYTFKSTVTTDNPFVLTGWSTNKAVMESSSAVAGETLIEVTGGNLIGIHGCHFRENTAENQPGTWVKVSSSELGELNIRNSEFRDAQNWGVELDATGGTAPRWNDVIGSWFLGGAGLRIDGADDMQIVGCKFRSFADLEITNSSGITRRGNLFDEVEENISSTEFARPDEAVGDIDANSLTQDFVMAKNYDSLQSAIDEADSRAIVYLGNKQYSENVTVSGELTLMGSAQTGNANIDGKVTASSSNVTIKNARIEGDSNGDAVELNGFSSYLTGCRLEGAVTIGASECRVTDNSLRNHDVTIESGADNNVIVGNAAVGTVTDNGTGNEVSSNS